MLNSFSVTGREEVLIDQEIDEVWSVLLQPDVWVRHTPFLRAITVLDEDHWQWEIAGVAWPGGTIGAVMTERMRRISPRCLTFTQLPGDRPEVAGADGRFDLSPVLGNRSTLLDVTMTVTARLPLPRSGSAVVQAAMRQVLTQMLKAFVRGLAVEVEHR